jgi:hypothetical protein
MGKKIINYAIRYGKKQKILNKKQEEEQKKKNYGWNLFKKDAKKLVSNVVKFFINDFNKVGKNTKRANNRLDLLKRGEKIVHKVEKQNNKEQNNKKQNNKEQNKESTKFRKDELKKEVMEEILSSDIEKLKKEMKNKQKIKQENI